MLIILYVALLMCLAYVVGMVAGEQKAEDRQKKNRYRY